MHGEIVRTAPAKVNLALHVTGRRPDGYHLLDSLVVFTTFGDRISVAEADMDRFSVAGRFGAHVPTDGNNLVLQARDLLRRMFPEQSHPPVHITLTKTLPVASGIGGGSADAAATLAALLKFWCISSAPGDLARDALSLGADLPMCLASRPLIARGIGEDLAPLVDMPALALVLVNPGVAVSTPQVFSALTNRSNAPLPDLPKSLDAPALGGWLTDTRNDLQAAACGLAPSISEALAELRAAGALVSRMSGSGATCYGLFAEPGLADAAAHALSDRFPHWFVMATETMPSEDAHGPR